MDDGVGSCLTGVGVWLLSADLMFSGFTIETPGEDWSIVTDGDSPSLFIGILVLSVAGAVYNDTEINIQITPYS